MNTKIMYFVAGLLVGVIGGHYYGHFHEAHEMSEMHEAMEEEGDEMSAMEITDDVSTEGMEMDVSGIHIMADGSVMLGNGDMATDATVTDDGMVLLSDGKIVKPLMDMREMEGMDNME